MKKKSMFFLMAMFVIMLPSFAQNPVPANDLADVSGIVFDLSTFAGIVAFVSLVVTQLAKKLPVVETNTILKILVSVAVGMLASLLSWKFGWADFLAGLLWWQVLVQGALAGLAACGAYDLIKSVIGVKQK
ncbi:MAG: hypothetical protein LBV74_21010 [Tannerella sp.]|jgi:hypothetical protein|nr:hypothetical protein [Tannerella sp.]